MRGNYLRTLGERAAAAEDPTELEMLLLVLCSLLVVQAIVIPVRDSGDSMLLFLGDGTVVQGDKGSHGFIDVLQEELRDTALIVEGAGSLSFNLQEFAKPKVLARYLELFKPNALMLMLFDDAISSLAAKIEKDKVGDVYSAAFSPLQDMVRMLEVTISHIRRIDATIDITVATPLVFHRNEDVVEEVCEIFCGMLKRVAFDYKVGIWDVRYPLRKYFEHHYNVDTMRQWDPSNPSSVRGKALPNIVGGEVQESGKLFLNHKGHAIIAHQLVSYYELGEIEKSVREKRLRPHLKGSGLTHKHFHSWHQDSAKGLSQYHSRRNKGREEAREAFKKRIEEEIRLNNPELTSKADPNDQRQRRKTAADRKRAKKNRRNEEL